MMRAASGVLSGVVVWMALWVVANGFLANVYAEEARVFQQGGTLTHTTYLLVALILSIPCSLLARGVIIRLARARARSAVVIATVILVTLAIATQAKVWERMPVWYHVALVLILASLMLRRVTDNASMK
jgi:hypothetical protein